MRKHFLRLTAVADLLAILLASASASAGAQSWSWTYQPPSPVGVDSASSGFSRPDSNGFWAMGSRLRHYHVDGSLDFVAGASLGPGPSAALPGGGLLAGSQSSPPQIDFMQPYSCILAAYTAQGGLSWTQTLPSNQSYCQKVQLDGNAVVWAAASADGLNAFSLDGVLLARLRGDAQTAAFADFVADPAPAGGVFAALPGAPASVRSYGDNAALRWSWTDANTAAALDRLALGSDGNLYAAGRSSAATPSALHLVSLGTDGTLRFSRDAALTVAAVYGIAATTDGAFYVVDALAVDASGWSSLALQRVAGDGSVVWSRNFDSAAACIDSISDCGATVTAQGDVLVVANTAAGPATLWRYDDAGNLQTAVATGGASGMVALASGDALLSVSDDDGGSYHLARVDRVGNTLTPPSAAVMLDAFISHSALTRDGTSFVATNDAGGHQIARIDADGRLVWRIDLESSAISATDIGAGGGLLCESGARQVGQFSYDTLVSCFAAGSGAPAWSLVLDQAVFNYPHVPLHVFDDGSVLALHFADHLLLSSSGAILHRLPLPELAQAPYIAIADNGTTVLLPQPESHIVAYGSDGAKLYDVELPVALQSIIPSADLSLTVLDDGTTIVTAYTYFEGTVTPYAWAIGPSGSTLWLQPLTTAQTPGQDSNRFSASVAAGPGGKLYFDLGAAPDSPLLTVTLQSRSLTNGHMLWQDANVAQTPNFSRVLVNPVSGDLVLLATDLRTLDVSAIAGNTGALRNRVKLPCAACDIDNAQVSTSDVLLANALVYGEPAPLKARLFALRNATAAPTAIRIDQPGLDGAWYAPYESGQGFTFDWIASAATVFMPWFTFAQSGINDPSGLAWYTLQGGGIAPGATGADLAIAVSNAGAFNSGSVPGRQVGTAHLSFSDCNSGTLYYQFDADVNGGAGGLISLTRLTPSTDPCVLADGSAAPAQNTNAPANGFDAKQSGSWYDPSTGGQGMELTVIPAGNGSAGLVFVPWFTFDPSGRSDDALNQHWFTLQGDLSAAQAGTVTLPIYRIIGGSFDATPTANFAPVGHATLTMHGCDSARFDYTFDTTDVAHAFAGLAGSMNLVRIGGCR